MGFNGMAMKCVILAARPAIHNLTHRFVSNLYAKIGDG